MKLLQSYLESRKQYLQIFDAISETIPILHGVPQGSVLGPLLFIIYINDLPKVLNASHTYLFADDTALIKKGNKRILTFRMTLEILKIGQKITIWLLILKNLSIFVFRQIR